MTVEAYQKSSPGPGAIAAVVRGITGSHADVSSSSMWGSRLQRQLVCQHMHLLLTHDVLTFKSMPSDAGQFSIPQPDIGIIYRRCPLH